MKTITLTLLISVSWRCFTVYEKHLCTRIVSYQAYDLISNVRLRTFVIKFIFVIYRKENT